MTKILENLQYMGTKKFNVQHETTTVIKVVMPILQEHSLECQEASDKEFMQFLEETKQGFFKNDTDEHVYYIDAEGRSE
jgi:hypothetical protein